MREKLALLGIFACAAATAACQTSVDSSSVLTSGVSAQITVTGQGNGQSTVNVILKEGDVNSSVNLDLKGGDALVAKTGGVQATLNKSSAFGFTSYSAQFNNGADAENAGYTIAFNRTVDKGAPSSTCTLPTVANFTGPGSNTSFSRANDDITFTWSPSGSSDKMHYKLSGNCIFSDEKDIVGDPGTLTIPKGSIRGTTSGQNGQQTACSMNITIQRIRAGQLDSGYGRGGSIACLQERVVQVTSTP